MTELKWAGFSWRQQIIAKNPIKQITTRAGFMLPALFSQPFNKWWGLPATVSSCVLVHVTYRHVTAPSFKDCPLKLTILAVMADGQSLFLPFLILALSKQWKGKINKTNSCPENVWTRAPTCSSCCFGDLPVISPSTVCPTQLGAEWS